MYRAYLHDPKSVHASWQAYFKNVNSGLEPGKAYAVPPTLIANNVINPPSDAAQNIMVNMPGSNPEIVDHLKIQLLVRAYQVRGHLLAQLDPLGINQPPTSEKTSNELQPSFYGFTEKDMDRKFQLGPGILQHFYRSLERV